MSGLEVKAVVASIISAFASGMDIFKRMRRDHKVRKLKRSKNAHSEELRLQQSLQRGPQDIKAEYERSVRKLGDGFATGDLTAQASLARILLVLNTGLMNIISSALSKDRDARERGRRSLLSLSELSTADTLQALDQLNQRLSRPPSLLLTYPSTSKQQSRHDKHRHAASTPSFRLQDGSDKRAPQRKGVRSPETSHGGRSSSISTSSHASRGNSKTVPASRGAWVRSRTDSSISTATTAVSSSPDHSRASSTHGQRPTLSSRRTNSSSSQGQDSKIQVPADMHRNHRRYSSLEYEETQQNIPPPAVPPKIPLTVTRTPSTPRKMTPSVFSFMSDSTKLGEIPEHKWITPAAYYQPVDAPFPMPIQEERKEKQKFGARFWRRFKKDTQAESVVGACG